jgi:small subunit ribosomal protein S12
MVTINQIIRKNPRKKQIKTKKNAALEQNPFKQGICRRILIISPKKPNRANRKIAKIQLSNGRLITASIPGEGNHNLQQHSVVLVRGCRIKDLPGVNYKVVRGVFDLIPVATRTRARSKFGTRKPKK